MVEEKPPETTTPNSSEIAPPSPQPSIIIPAPSNVSEIKKRSRKDRPQSRTFETVLTTFYKRPSEQVGGPKAIFADRYRHESIGDNIDEIDDVSENGNIRPTEQGADTPTNSHSNRNSVDKNHKDKGDSKDGKSKKAKRGSDDLGNSDPPSISEDNHRRKNMDEEDDWDLYEHHTKNKSADEEDEPSGCCIIS